VILRSDNEKAIPFLYIAYPVQASPSAKISILFLIIHILHSKIGIYNPIHTFVINKTRSFIV